MTPAQANRRLETLKRRAQFLVADLESLSISAEAAAGVYPEEATNTRRMLHEVSREARRMANDLARY